jgi:uracil-DNA glycosylase
MKDEPGTLDAIVRQARALLLFHRQCGLDYPLSAELRNFLAPRARSLQPAPSGRPPTPPVAMSREITVPGHRTPSTTLDDLRQGVEDCHHCPLGRSEQRMIFGEGSARQGVALFIICDPPGPEETARHEPISGEARALLVKMLGAISLSLTDIYLTNIVKCGPPEQRMPTPAEATACLPFLMRQIELVKPRIICTMGQAASQIMLRTTQPMVSLRGRFHDFKGTPLMPTFHPSLLLKLPELKKGSWHDLQMIHKKLEGTLASLGPGRK